jgi:high-affinity Fe2+/Pb2+ permease
MKLCFVSAGSGGSEINEILINEFSKCTQYEIISIAITPYAKQKLSQFIYVEQLNIIDYLETLPF